MKNGLSAIYDIEGEASAFTFEECCLNLVEEMEKEKDELWFIGAENCKFQTSKPFQRDKVLQAYQK